MHVKKEEEEISIKMFERERKSRVRMNRRSFRFQSDSVFTGMLPTTVVLKPCRDFFGLNSLTIHSWVAVECWQSAELLKLNGIISKRKENVEIRGNKSFRIVSWKYSESILNNRFLCVEKKSKTKEKYFFRKVHRNRKWFRSNNLEFIENIFYFRVGLLLKIAN